MKTPMQIEIVDTTPMWKKIVKNPFRSYAKIGGFTFGLTLIGNFVTTLFDSQQRNMMLGHSQIFTATLLTKSLYFSVLWPSFYLTALVNPKSVFVLGHGVSNLVDLENWDVKVNGKDMTSKDKEDFIKKIQRKREKAKKSFKDSIDSIRL